MKTVSFDFDKTITEKAGYAYAKELVGRGYRVIVVTQRPPAMHREVFKVAHRLGLEIDSIYFCGVQSKEDVLYNLDYAVHIDDKKGYSRNWVVFEDGFKDKCEKLLK